MYIVDAFYSLDSGIMPWYTFLKKVSVKMSTYIFIRLPDTFWKLENSESLLRNGKTQFLRSILIGPYLDTDQIKSDP